MRKKIISALLALVMVLTLLPMSAMAAGTDEISALHIPDNSMSTPRYTSGVGNVCDLSDSSEKEELLDYTVPDGGLTVLIFFRAQGCTNSDRLIDEIVDTQWAQSDLVNIVAVESNACTREIVQAYMSEHDPGKVIDKVYYNHNNNAYAFWYNMLVERNGDMTGVNSLEGAGFSAAYILLITEENGTKYIEYAIPGVYTSALVNGYINDFVGTSDPSFTDTTVTVTVPGKQRYDYAKEVFDKVNIERQNANASALTFSEKLTELAMQRAAELAVYYDHTRPNRDGPFSVNGTEIGGTAVTYNGLVSENIALGQTNPDAVMHAWMTSTKGHKENILNTGHKQVGVGCFENNGRLYWVQLFGTGNDAAVTKEGSVAVDVPVETSTLRLELSISPEKDIDMEAGGTADVPALINANQGHDSYFAVLKPALPEEISGADGKAFATVSYGAAGTGMAQFKAAATGGAEVAIAAYEGQTDAPKIKLTVNGKALDRSMFTVNVDAAAYTGEAITKEIKSELALGTDYTVEYKDNTNAGTATITIKGMGSYTGELTYNFTINKAKRVITATAGKTEFFINDQKLTDSTDVTIQDNAEKENPTYTYDTTNGSVAAAGNGRITATGIGTATITVKAPATANYEAGTAEINVTVKEVQLTKLGTPTELKWGLNYGWDWGVVDQSDPPEVPGMASWKNTEPSQNVIEVSIYLDGTDEPAATEAVLYGGADIKLNEYLSTDLFLRADLGSGTYYFTVRYLGDNITYADGDAAKSETWTYTQPEEKLPKVDIGTWDWPSVTCTPITNDMLDGYEVMFLFSETADGEPRIIHRMYQRSIADVRDWTIPNALIQWCGTGYYYFRVRALSKDITVARNGDWSELSEAYNLADLYAGIKDSLDAITDEPGSEAAKQAVQALDQDMLKSAMLAGQGEEDSVVDKLAELEKTPAAVDVKQSVSKFEEDDVSVIGANLNMEEGKTATLVIDRPSNDQLKIPDQYNSTVAIKFDLHLEVDSEKYEERLKVPVQVTLPIPAGINPAFLTIIHYRQDGNIDSILTPFTFQKDGKWYASIVLDHFSDFAMTTERAYYTVNVDSKLTGGTVTVTPNRYEAGDVVTLHVTPDNKYTVDAVIVTCDSDSSTVTATVNSDGTYSFIMPASNVTVTATFKSPGGGTGGGTGGGFGGGSGGGSSQTNTAATVRKEGSINGAFTVSNEKAKGGEIVTVTTKANSGYATDKVTVTDVYGNAIEVKANGDGTYSFVMPEAYGQPVTVRVTFKLAEGSASSRFTDLDRTKWYYDAVDYVLEHGLMNGVGEYLFDPDGVVSRAQMVMVLWNMSGKPVVNYYMSYSDVSEGAWYAEAVRWATSEGIVDGYGNGRFGPNDPITREQMAAMLYRYEKKHGSGGFTGDWMFRLPFTDTDKISDWAYEAVAWCNMQGIIEGKDTGAFDPSGSAKRCEMAAVLMRYGNNTAK